MSGEKDQGLPGGGRVGERLLGTDLGPLMVTDGVVIAGPAQVAIGSSQPGAIPGQPAVVGLQPGSCLRRVTRLEGEVGGQSLQEEGLLVHPGFLA